MNGNEWRVSLDSTEMTYWEGVLPGRGKCACEMNNLCADSSYGCKVL